MDIYLVRHGQTDGNVAKRHQHPGIDINKTGEAQAARVAKVIESLKPTHLITSTSKRAVETAKYIAIASDLIPETYPAFEELKRPLFLQGERFYALRSLYYVAGWFFGIKTVSMHDGESYKDFLFRLNKAKQHLEALPANSRVVVVSHAVFISLFIEHLNRHRRMGLRRAVLRFVAMFRLKNTAVTHLRYVDGKWSIVERF